MYIREDIIVNVSSFKHLNTNNQNLESLWVECKLDFMKNIIVGNFYRPPSGNHTYFINHILDISNTIGNIKNKEVYILGDININLKEKSNISNLLVESMKLCKLIQIINVPTRLGKTKNTLLDHIYTNCNAIQAKGTGPFSISDHLLVYCTRKNNKKTFTNEYYKGRKIIEDCFPDFINDVNEINWFDVFNSDNINEIWNRISQNLNKCADNHFPIRNLRKKPKEEKWLTPEIQKEIKEKNILLVIAKKTELEEDKIAAHKKRNYVNQLVSKAKKNYFKEEQILRILRMYGHC